MLSGAQLAKIWQNALALGARRLSLLAGTGLSILLFIGLGGYYLSAPDVDVLYSGLSQQDVSRIGAALTESGIGFDVSSDGTKVLVRPSQTARARMLLAEKGLPASSTAGNELFDKLGSMGLTSFMQEITRVRALEGELARSIQTLRGVRAARVHIVLPASDSFRRDRSKPSASVVVKLENSTEAESPKAIRHLVAAAVPGMALNEVQVVTTDGAVLVPEGDSASELPSKMMEIERTVSKDLRERIRKTLAPYLGSENFEISVSAAINFDKRQTSETAFDPKSKVERSTRVVRQADNAQNSSSKTAAGVEQNVPGEEAAQTGGEISKKSNDRREELSNFEINTKSISTESQGYRVDQLAVAVLVNRKRMVEAAGGSVVPGSLDAQLKEVESLVKSSAGLSTARGDQVTVAAVDFLPSTAALEPMTTPGMGEILLGQLGSIIRSLTILAVTAVFLLFGFRPMTRMLLEQAPALQAAAAALPSPVPLSGADARPGGTAGELPPPDKPKGQLAKAESREENASLASRLEQIVNADEDHAAAILKQWLQRARLA
jgi:flagellar M-ring protein FliF